LRGALLLGLRGALPRGLLLLSTLAFGLDGTLLLGAFRLGAFAFGLRGAFAFGLLLLSTLAFGLCGSLLLGAFPFGPLGLCDLLLLGALAFGLRSAFSLRCAAIPPPQRALLPKSVTWLYGVVLLIRGLSRAVVLLCFLALL
jgi:hypothetical protein